MLIGGFPLRVSAVGQPNGLFGVSGEVIEKVWTERNHVMRLAADLGHLTCHMHIETISIDAAIGITRRRLGELGLAVLGRRGWVMVLEQREPCPERFPRRRAL